MSKERIESLPITVDPEILSGEPVFKGTRVPVAALLDNLAAGVSLDEFLENFPTVTREQAQQVLEFAKNAITEKALAWRTIDYFKERTARGSKEKFFEALSKVPHVKPDESDRLD